MAKPLRSVWEEPATRYNEDAPWVQRAMRSEKWKRRVLGFLAFVAVPVAFIAGMGAFSAASRLSGTAGVDPAAVSSEANSSAGKAAAMTALREWLAADPAPLPGAVMLSWDGYAVQAPPPAEPGEEPVRYRFEQHRFTLLRSGLVYAATVLVAVGDGGAAAVVGTPGIVQSPGVELDIAVGQWIGLAETTAPGPVREAVESWARAYASGDANALRREVQDREAGRAYMPLVGVAGVASVQVVAAGYDPKAYRPDDKPAELVVRVRVSYRWTAPAEGREDRNPPAVTYDLLVHGADTATPYVVAWGGPGSGPDLVPYQNGITSGKLTVPAPPSPRPAAPADGDEPAEEVED